MMKFAALTLVFALTLSVSVMVLGADAKKGEEVYNKNNCKTCHSIAGAPANRKFPLDGVGARLTAELMMKWIRSPQEMKKGTSMPTFAPARISETDLADIVAYLLTLKK